MQFADYIECMVPDLGFQLVCYPANIREKVKILFSQPVFNRALCH